MRCNATVEGRSLAIAARAIQARRRRNGRRAVPPPPENLPPSAAAEAALTRYATYAPHPQRQKQKQKQIKKQQPIGLVASPSERP
ncbi:MAG TPA: hypothetical protein VIJ79_04445 [Acidobacteriaceae bacterium]